MDSRTNQFSEFKIALITPLPGDLAPVEDTISLRSARGLTNPEGMNMPRHVLIALALAAVATTMAADDSKQPPFKIMTKRDDDRVAVKVEKNKAIVSVHSPFGISHAVIERTGEKWPDLVVLHLYLKGLENFRVTNGTTKLEASVSSQDSTVRLWDDGKEESPLDAKSPYRIAVRMVGDDCNPAKTIPLKDGYFEIQLPKASFEGNPKSITVEWIDFYRS